MKIASYHFSASVVIACSLSLYVPATAQSLPVEAHHPVDAEEQRDAEVEQLVHIVQQPMSVARPLNRPTRPMITAAAASARRCAVIVSLPVRDIAEVENGKPDVDCPTESDSRSADDRGLTGAAEKPLNASDWSAVFEPMPATATAVHRNSEDTVHSFAAHGHRDPYFGASERITFPWEARNLAHRTLFFEDMPLERYGQTHRKLVQPIKSGVRFLADYVTLPLQMIHERPCDFHYVLGLDRPGSHSCQVSQPVIPHAK